MVKPIVKQLAQQAGTPANQRGGFALMSVLVTIAVIAILAGVLGPLAFRQMMKARENETLLEMDTLQDGLLAFFADTGRFPTDGEGLAALAVDPGVTGWQGPYLVGDRYVPADEITTDAFGQDYIFDLDPVTDPPGDTNLILVSGGVDRSVSSGAVDGLWTLDGDDDDLRVLINSGPANRDMTVQAADEMQALSHAAQKYFEDLAAFPTTTAALQSTYLSGGFSGEAFSDPWLQAYILNVDNNANPPTMNIRSYGPDRADNSGAGDDLTLEVSSVVPGRKSTYYMIRIAQASVDKQTATSMTGDWNADRADFDLTAAFDNDGWGNLYEEAMSTRTVVSAGPDADYLTPDDNIPPGVIPDDTTPPPAGDNIEYVEGSGVTDGSHCNQFSFSVTNTTSGDVIISSITLTWSGPTAFYPKIRIDGNLVLNSSNPKIASGEEAVLDSPYTLTASSTIEIDIQAFVSKKKSGGSKVDMSNIDILVEFDEGSSFTFNTGPCN